MSEPLIPSLVSLTNETTTRGIRIAVLPEYNEPNSNPEASVYVYTYAITITNEGKDVVQLISRHWIIRDGFNRIEHVVGEGVVGHKPVLKPGESFTYSSFCPLPTPTGTMQGTFQMRGSDNQLFDAAISEFQLRNKALVN